LSSVAPLLADLRDQGTMPDASPQLGDPASLRRRLAEDGFLLLRGLLPADRVLGVRRLAVGLMRDAGWLQAAEPRPLARPDMPLEGEPSHPPTYRQLLHHPDFRALAHAPELLAAIGSALDAPVRVHRRIIGRLAPPHQPPTQPHQDWQYIRGSQQTLTAWIPLGDCPRELGGLAVLPGSHHLGFREHRRTSGAGGMGVPVDDLTMPWLSADYHSGDVLLFPALTVHAALPNRTAGEVRLSADFRYQRPDEAIHPDSLRHHFDLD
jgi:hypothetical protein